MIELSRGTAAQFEEIIDFLDFVFSKNSSGHDFPKMYPNLYHPTDESMHNLITLREDGVLKGCILSYPWTLSIGGTELSIHGIGNVAAHPRTRGRGFMSTMMNYNVAELKKQGVAMSCLGGRRSRYNHFGYEGTGIRYFVGLGPTEVQTAFPGCAFDDITFRPFSADDAETAKLCKALYETKPVHFVYNTMDDFVLRFYDWSGKQPYAVYKNGEFIGYIAMERINPANNRTELREIVLKDEADCERVIYAFIRRYDAYMRLRLAPWQLQYFTGLLRISGTPEICGSGMWNILDWPKVLQAFLAFKSTFTTLEEGTLVVDIGEEGRYALTFQNGVASVERTGAPADLNLAPLDARYALFSPCPDTVLGSMLPIRVMRLVRSWFPLPLTTFDTERV